MLSGAPGTPKLAHGLGKIVLCIGSAQVYGYEHAVSLDRA